jgi:hypothetical protein
MNPLSRITGRAVDRALGFPAPAVPYVLRCRFEIHHDARHTAHVLLPVLPHRDRPEAA